MQEILDVIKNNKKINWRNNWNKNNFKDRELRKNKLMENIIQEDKQRCALEIDQEEVEQVTKIKYLGSMMTSDNQYFIVGAKDTYKVSRNNTKNSKITQK